MKIETQEKLQTKLYNLEEEKKDLQRALLESSPLRVGDLVLYYDELKYISSVELVPSNNSGLGYSLTNPNDDGSFNENAVSSQKVCLRWLNNDKDDVEFVFDKQYKDKRHGDKKCKFLICSMQILKIFDENWNLIMIISDYGNEDSEFLKDEFNGYFYKVMTVEEDVKRHPHIKEMVERKIGNFNKKKWLEEIEEFYMFMKQGNKILSKNLKPCDISTLEKIYNPERIDINMEFVAFCEVNK